MDNKTDKSNIKEILSDFYNNQNFCGFVAFVVMKTDPKLKIISLSEDKNDDGKTFREVLKDLIFTVINDCYLIQEVEYIDGTYLADNQNKIFVINQSGEFKPFDFLENKNIVEYFDINDLDDACGIIFRLRKGRKTIWCYQHIWSLMVPNRKKNNIMARINKFENHTVFEQQNDRLFTITKKIDILIIDGCVVTSNTKLLQNNFGFQNYIYQSAENAVSNIVAKKLVSNSEKLTEYIYRGKPKYAKKMMRISNSQVFILSKEELLDKISFVERWKGKFCVDDSTNQIVLNTYKDVENLIDLFDERFTRSEITGKEYDTDVKIVAEPIIANAR